MWMESLWIQHQSDIGNRGCNLTPCQHVLWMLPGSFLSLCFGLRSWSFVRNYCYRGLGFVFAFNFFTNQSCPVGARAMLCAMGNSSVTRAYVRSWTYPVDHANHLAFIPVSLGYQPGYWRYCVFFPKCLRPVTLWQLRTWIGRQEWRLPCEPSQVTQPPT